MLIKNLRLPNLNKNLIVLSIYFISAFILYAPVLNNGFALDDYHFIQLASQKGLSLVEGFFRPVSQLSIYIDLKLWGFNSFAFHLTNLILHVFCAWFLHLVARRIFQLVANELGFRESLFVGFLFLIYPFHSEPIFWISGRSGSLATFFALLTLLSTLSHGVFTSRVLWTSIFFSISLLAYENVLPISLIVVILSFVRKDSKRQIYTIGAFMIGMIIVNFIIRIFVMGSILGGEYASPVYDSLILERLGNLFRFFTRLFTPPFHSIIGYLATVLSLFVLLLVLLRVVYYKQKRLLILLFLLLIVSSFVSFTFPVSTKTSETDRLLYFPSVFFVLLLSLPSFYLKHLNKIVYTICLLLFQLVFVIDRINAWEYSTDMKEDILGKVKKAISYKKKIVLVNVPKDYEGAFFLANVVDDALKMEHIDISYFYQANMVNGVDVHKWGGLIDIAKGSSNTFIIPPETTVYKIASDSLKIVSNKTKVLLSSNDEIWYFNGAGFKKFEEN